MISALVRVLAAGALAAVALGAAAHDAHQHHTGGKPPAAESVRLRLPDTALLDHDGRSRRFASEVIGERIVLVDFVYTTCTTVCPIASALFAQVQQRLGERLAQDVRLVTVTVDPVRDTPARLKTYAARYDSGAGWTWLTGAKPQVDEVLKALGAWTPNFENHPPLVLVGDAKAGRWLRFYGFPTPEQLTDAVRELTASRARAG
jgi:protein SCO1/2